MDEVHSLPTFGRLPILYDAAPTAPLPAPEVEVLDDRAGSARPAWYLAISVEPSTAVRAAVIDGQRVENESAAEEDAWSLIYFSAPQEGFELTLEWVPTRSPATPSRAPRP